jgi:hypothetical protein
MPDPATGELKIDPDIELKAKKFNLALSFFYSSHSTTNAEYGRGRAASVRGQAVSSSGGAQVAVIWGDFRQYQFTMIGASGGIITYSGVTSEGTTTLSFDGIRFQYLRQI